MNLIDLNEKSEGIILDEYISFRNIVKAYMINPKWLGDFTKKDLQQMLNTTTKIWMYYKKYIPVCSMMAMTTTKEDLQKLGLDLNPKSVIDYGPMFVNPDYVGNGLQLQMLEKLDSYSIDNNFEYAILTAHPDNIYSINNIDKAGFTCYGQKEFNRGTRNIYVKRI